MTQSAAAQRPQTAYSAGVSTPPPTVGITVFGCDPDEAALCREIAPGLGVEPTITPAAVSERNAGLARGNRCISIGHRSVVRHEVLSALGEVGVEYISTRSVGYNHIDVNFAERVGITVETVAYSPGSVADYTLMLMLMALRHVKAVMRRADAHDYRLPDTRGRELGDLTVGVIGTGHIGRAVLDRLRGFGCVTLAHDIRPKTSAEYVTLDTLLERSDVITLHTPLTAATHHLLDRHRIARMRPGAVIVNTGRGSLLDTDALVAALEDGRLGGAALDVIEGEERVFYADWRDRPVENRALLRLQRMPNVVISPHTAYHTDHALSDMVEHSLANCVRFAGRRRTGEPSA